MRARNGVLSCCVTHKHSEGVEWPEGFYPLLLKIHYPPRKFSVQPTRISRFSANGKGDGTLPQMHPPTGTAFTAPPFLHVLEKQEQLWCQYLQFKHEEQSPYRVKDNFNNDENERRARQAAKQKKKARRCRKPQQPKSLAPFKHSILIWDKEMVVFQRNSTK